MMSQWPSFLSFFAASSLEKDTKIGTAVTSLRFFLFRDDFSFVSNFKYQKFENISFYKYNVNFGYYSKAEN